MIINSILDNDLYKFTMMHAVREKYPEAKVVYSFISRDTSHTFTTEFLEILKRRVKELGSLALADHEYVWLKKQGFFPVHFLKFLRDFRLNSSAVSCHLDDQGQLVLKIAGNWAETILFEVPLLALISQTYYEVVEKNWDGDLTTYAQKTFAKGQKLSQAGCHFSDFGTRRRRSYQIQKTVVDTFSHLPAYSTFVGTSNVHLAQIFDTKPIGTMAHEWIMGHGGMFGIPGATAKALETWLDVYKGKFGVALTDTYSTRLFFKEFSKKLAKKYEGIRQDSGDPIAFTDEALRFYESVSIDAKKKKIIYSDRLNTESAIAIERYLKNRVQGAYGIGTFFTNDFNHVRSLNIVIKMTEINGVRVAKITDSLTKASGEDLVVEDTRKAVDKLLV